MTIRFQVEGHLARVTIDRPDRMNALDSASHARLAEIWSEIEATPDIRCVVLTGTGDKAFCAGADLKDDNGLTGVEYWQSIAKDYSGLSLRRTLKTPVIARVNGLALGGGMEVAMGCDIVIASDTAQFALPEAKVGRMPLDGGMVLLPRLIPRNIAVGMMLTGRFVPAEEMARYGFVNAVVPAGELDAEVDRWVADILNGAPLSLRAIKSLARDTAALPLHDAYACETPELIAALNSEDAQEGVQAFREKRAPVWKGR